MIIDKKIIKLSIYYKRNIKKWKLDNLPYKKKYVGLRL